MTTRQTTPNTTRPVPERRFNYASQSGFVACAAVVVICCFFPLTAPDKTDSVRIPVDPKVSSNPDDVGAATPIAFMVDLNQASARELAALPRIGETMAARIIDYREINGDFTTVDDLINVRGIGSKTLEKLKPFCYVTHKRSDQNE